jgi:hypothetical protein
LALISKAYIQVSTSLLRFPDERQKKTVNPRQRAMEIFVELRDKSQISCEGIILVSFELPVK